MYTEKTPGQAGNALDAHAGLTTPRHTGRSERGSLGNPGNRDSFEKGSRDRNDMDNEVRHRPWDTEEDLGDLDMETGGSRTVRQSEDWDTYRW